MQKELLDKIEDELPNFSKISPLFLMRKYKLNYDTSMKICCEFWKKKNMEARKMAEEIS